MEGLTQAERRGLFGGVSNLVVSFGDRGAVKQRRKSRGEGVEVEGDEIGLGWGKEGPAGEETGRVDNLEERVDTVKFGGGSWGMKSQT